MLPQPPTQHPAITGGAAFGNCIWQNWPTSAPPLNAAKAIPARDSDEITTAVVVRAALLKKIDTPLSFSWMMTLPANSGGCLRCLPAPRLPASIIRVGGGESLSRDICNFVIYFS